MFTASPSQHSSHLVCFSRIYTAQRWVIQPEISVCGGFYEPGCNLGSPKLWGCFAQWLHKSCRERGWRWRLKNLCQRQLFGVHLRLSPWLLPVLSGSAHFTIPALSRDPSSPAVSWGDLSSSCPYWFSEGAPFSLWVVLWMQGQKPV